MARGVILSLRLLRRQPTSRGQTLELLLSVACAAAVAGPLAANAVTDPGSLRYFLVLMIAPLLWLEYHALRAAVRSPLRHLTSATASVLLFACVLFVSPAISAAKRIVAPLPLELCLKAQGQVAGYGDYWTAKALIFASDRRIHVVQLAGEKPYHWNTNERWFFRRADDGAPLNLHFIFPERLNPQRLRGAFGPPDSTLNCEGQEVWFYKDALPVVR